jgi:hypothetical protein
MSIEGSSYESKLDLNSERVDYRSNEKQYHIVFPGSRKNRWGDKFSNTEEAYRARELLINIAIEERKQNNKGTLSNIAVYLGVRPIMLSRAASGTLSNTPMAKYEGKSPKEFIMQTLEKYYQEHYQVQDNSIK